MQNITIKFPKYFTYWTFDPFLEQIQSILPNLKNSPQNITFDFSETENVSVLGVLLLAKVSDELRGLKCNCLVICPPHGGEKNSISE